MSVGECRTAKRTLDASFSDDRQVRANNAGIRSELNRSHWRT